MPELPEVETVVRRLRPLVKDRQIVKVAVTWPRIVGPLVPAEFSSRLLSLKFASIDRRGKYLIFSLRPHGYIVAHLRMSGDFLVVKSSQLKTKHQHVIITLNNGSDLRFDDTRKFGRVLFVNNPEGILDKLGPEPLSTEFSPQRLFSDLQRKSKIIKNLLLDQTFIAGIGNIYAVESLWQAKIHPLLPANQIGKKQAAALHRSIVKILNKAIEAQGTDIGDGVWKAGNFVTKCYGRANLPCSRCRTKIMKIVVAQRGTEYCPNCQRKN